MLRFLNILFLMALIASAGYAYTIKYQTSYRSEQIAKTKLEIKAEQDAIAVLRAEWAFLTRPERLQQLSDKYLDLKPMAVAQIVPATAIPEKSARVEAVGAEPGALPSTPVVGAAVTTPKAPTATVAGASAKGATPARGAARKP